MGGTDKHTAQFENLKVEIRDGAAWITLNRPDKLNALDRRTVEELVRAVEQAEGNGQVRALVLAGAGEKAFAAGADIGELAALDAGTAQAHAAFLQRSFERIERCSKPVIAAIQGFALGGGCELALACHLRIASQRARFGQPEVNLGLIPGAGATQRLPRIVGRGRALYLILSGEMIDADRAREWGLVHEVVPVEQLDDAVSQLVATLGGKSPLALHRALDAVLSGTECSQSEGLRFEAGLFGLCFATEDMREGTSAFLEKRKPAFPGK